MSSNVGRPASQSASLAEALAGFRDPPRTAAPMMRWWWFGPSVQRAELDRELRAMAAAGIGGVEVAYVYPLAPATTDFLAPGFLADLRWSAERARDLGLRFDLTLGSGWSFGGPHIASELAARRLHWDRREVAPGEHRIPIPAGPVDDVLAAFVGNGSLQECPDDFAPVPVEDGLIVIADGRGPRTLLLATARPTGQNVKRASAGAEGPVLDHYRADATRAHLRAVADPLLDAVPAEFLGSVFCDSLEVYGSDWTPALPEEFERRRGYPLLPELHLLLPDAGDGPVARAFRADYHRTLIELYEQHFVALITGWARRRGVPFRIQGYGTPPAMISSYRHADLVEGEGWGWKEVTQTRWASSAGHLYRRSVVSAEVWTWVHSPSFRATPLDLLGEAHEHLLNGINAFIGHGWPYSPADAPGLGWFFYAAGALDDRNPWWPAMPDLIRRLARLCWLMRQGEPVADVAVCVPEQDVFAQLGTATGGSLDAWRETRRSIGDTVIAAIRENGYDYDLIDDEAVALVAPEHYPVVITVGASSVPAGTRAWLGRVQASGGTVITVDSSFDFDAAVTATESGVAAALQATRQPDLSITPSSPDVGFVHRRLTDGDVYLVINTGPERRSLSLRPRATGKSFQRWDPHSGDLIAGGPTDGQISCELPAYQATVIVTSDRGLESAEDVHDHDQPPAWHRVEITDWTVTFPGEAAEPLVPPHVWERGAHHQAHTGSAHYRAEFDLGDDLDRAAGVDLATGVDLGVGPGAEPAAQVMIDFGEFVAGDDRGSGQSGMVGPSYRVADGSPIGEVASVRVNGADCGVVWAPPYQLDLSAAVRHGRNDLEVTVFNTAAHAVATDRHIRRLATEAETRDGRRFRMQQLDQADTGVRSGLRATPVLHVRARP